MRRILLGMKRLAVLTLILLPACVPSTIYYREGAAVASVDQALAQCTAQAARAVPVVLETRYTPLRVRRDTFCDADGNCDVEIETEGGEPYDVDVNTDRRAASVAQCMAAARFAPVTLPACPPDVARAAPAGTTTTLPRLTPQSCAVTRDGGVRIVTRG